MGTTTTNLGMYKPTAGEDAWSASVNANADKLDTLLGTLYAVDNTLTLTDLAAIVECRSPRLPTGVLGQTFRIEEAYVGADVETWVSGTLYLTPIVLLKGDTITSISYYSASQAAVSPTHWWFALYDSSYNLLKQTADQTSTAWGTSTKKTLNLSSTQLIATSGKYYVGWMMTAATRIKHMCSLYGGFYGVTTETGRTGASTSGLTTTAPNPCAALSDQWEGGQYATVQ